MAIFDDLVEEARRTLTEDRLNVFDQHRLNSFQRGKPFRRPIIAKLLDGTYRKYKNDWKHLLCYVIRVAHFRMGPRIHFRMTEPQILALDRLMHASLEFNPAENGAHKRLRRACLDLCIALLDHELKGNIYDSFVVGFIAAMGIDPKDKTFREPANFSNMLSGLIKLAQFFVALQAVTGLDEGEADFASDLLIEMQDRFMVYGSRSPIE